MAVSTKRRNVSKSKSKTLSKSNKVSSSRKHLIKSRKSGSKTRKMRGGGKGKGGQWSKMRILPVISSVEPHPKKKPIIGPENKKTTKGEIIKQKISNAKINAQSKLTIRPLVNIQLPPSSKQTTRFGSPVPYGERNLLKYWDGLSPRITNLEEKPTNIETTSKNLRYVPTYIKELISFKGLKPHPEVTNRPIYVHSVSEGSQYWKPPVPLKYLDAHVRSL